MEGGEGDLAMRKVGPVNGLKVRVIEELARVLLEGDECGILLTPFGVFILQLAP
jgi:hypothetical protein